MKKTETDPAGGVDLTLEDTAFLADGTGNIPDATARRLRWR